MPSILSSFLRRLTSDTPITHGQEQSIAPSIGAYMFNPKRPYFTRWLNQAMLVDSRIQYGLYLIKGPINSRSRFVVKSDNEELRQFIIDQLTRFWRTSAMIALESMDYGWYASEIMYRYHEGMVQFDHLQPSSPQEVTPYVDKGKLSGVKFLVSKDQNDENRDHVFLRRPKVFWTVHNRKKNRWWGQSRLYGSHVPWYEYNAREGFRDCRQLFYYKNCYDSGILYYPHGAAVDTNGNVVDNSNLADQIMELKRNGSAMTIPRTPGSGEAGWEYIPGQSQDLGEGFINYGLDLKEEMLEGMGVPPEVARAEGTGAFAGRSVPFEAFYSMLEEIVNEVVTDFDDQILQFLVKTAFGTQPADYAIESLAINTEEQTNEKTNWAMANQDQMPAKADGETPNPKQPTGQPIEEGKPTLYSDHLVLGTSLSSPEKFYAPDQLLFSTSLLRNAA